MTLIRSTVFCRVSTPFTCTLWPASDALCGVTLISGNVCVPSA